MRIKHYENQVNNERTQLFSMIGIYIRRHILSLVLNFIHKHTFHIIFKYISYH